MLSSAIAKLNGALRNLDLHLSVHQSAHMQWQTYQHLLDRLALSVCICERALENC